MVPFSQGETPLQHYNSLFCLQQLHTHTDGAILFHNDHTLAQVLKLNTSVSSAMGRSGSDRTMADVTVEDMNRHISNTLCNVLLPVWSDHHKLASFRAVLYIHVLVLCIYTQIQSSCSQQCRAMGVDQVCMS